AGILREVFHDDRSDRLGHAGGSRHRAQFRRRVVDLLDEKTDGLLALEGSSTSQHLIEERRDRVDIARGTDLLPLRALGRDVARGPEDETCGGGHRLLAPVEARDPEVEHLDVVGILAPTDKHDVLRLEVAMHDALRVSFTDRITQLKRDVKRAWQRE